MLLATKTCANKILEIREEDDNSVSENLAQCTKPNMLTIIREAILQKIPEFYEIISQTGRGGQSNFISLIQK